MKDKLIEIVTFDDLKPGDVIIAEDNLTDIAFIAKISEIDKKGRVLDFEGFPYDYSAPDVIVRFKQGITIAILKESFVSMIKNPQK